ncbi:MAG: molybdate ABC transporter substrate-binding protein [Verrucomicrobiota bacterium]|nr:molybdate ABC transporter substrate-binding protein [Verrucomicrobiota bacterium]
MRTGLVILAVAILAAHALHAAPVTVFAAASLTDALKAVAADYEQHSDHHIVFNFAASSTLARQIEAGAPADVFFSADEGWMDALAKRNLIVNATRRTRLSNALVVVVPAKGGAALTNLADLAAPNIKRIALADPRAVPAGIYAKALLEKDHLWAAVEPKVVPTENVRACLAAVASGNVDAGIVYKTDAAISRKVKTVMAVPPSAGPRIAYPMALLKDAPEPEAAKNFLYFLSGNEAGDIFARYGFIPLKTLPIHEP